MPAPSFDLKNKNILVTGSGRGIGKAIALRVAEAGANVGVTYTGNSEKSEANARAVGQQIEAMGAKAMVLALDLTQESQVSECVKRFTEQMGGLDGLVNNAGVAIDQLTARYKIEDWDALMNTNLRGAFLMSKAAMRPLMKAEGGSIVNMSSVVALMGNAGQVPYSASKAALIGLTKSLAREVASRNIRVNCVAPGFIQTDMTAAMGDKAADSLTAQIPLARLGSVDDIAWGVLYLLSPFSQYITGQVLSINGGLYM